MKKNIQRVVDKIYDDLNELISAVNNRDTVIAGTNLGGGGNSETNKLLSTLVRQNAKKPEISPVGLYSVQ